MHENEISFYNLESPTAGANVSSGWLQLRGWIAPKAGVHFVDVRARIGPRLFPGVYGFPRIDLAAHFTPTRRWLPAEYTVDLDLRPGPVNVEIEALNLTGEWQPIQRVAFVANDRIVAGIAHDPLGADEFGLATRLCLRRAVTDNHEAAAQIVSAIPYPPTLRSEHPPFHGFIDQPAALSATLYGRLPVLGWLFHETLAIRNAWASSDLLAWQRLEAGGEFAGVSDRFPNFPHAKKCGLFGFVEVSSQLPAPTSVRFYAELEDGSTHLCLATQVCAVGFEQLKTAYPTFSAKKFWQTWRSLKRELAARKIPLESGKKRTAEFWKTFSDYRRKAPRRVEPSAPAKSPPPEATTLAGQLVLLVTHNLNLEGAPLLFVEYARHLTKVTGARLVVLSGLEGPLREAFAALGAVVEIVDAPALLAASSPAELHRRIEPIAAKWSAQNVQAVVANTLFSFWGVQLARALRRPALLYIHESTDPAYFFHDRISPQLLPAVHEAFRDATAVSFNTAATEAYYRPYSPGGNFHLMSAWIDVSAIAAFREANSRAALRERLHLGPDEVLVANVGSVCDRKGQHDFLRAIEWFWRLKPALAARCRFLMIGGRDTPYQRALERNLADLGRANLQIIPETTRAYDYFGAADIFVCTSYEESFPRVVLEAMAFAVPIVSTPVHGIAFMLRSEEDALLVNPGDIPALVGALVRVLEEPTSAADRARKAQSRVAEFDASLVLPRHTALTAAVARAQA